MVGLRTAALSAALVAGATLANAADLVLRPAQPDQHGVNRRPPHDTPALPSPQPRERLFEEFLQWLKRR
jgi:hypothetical protein